MIEKIRTEHNDSWVAYNVRRWKAIMNEHVDKRAARCTQLRAAIDQKAGLCDIRYSKSSQYLLHKDETDAEKKSLYEFLWNQEEACADLFLLVHDYISSQFFNVIKEQFNRDGSYTEEFEELLDQYKSTGKKSERMTAIEESIKKSFRYNFPRSYPKVQALIDKWDKIIQQGRLAYVGAGQQRVVSTYKVISKGIRKNIVFRVARLWESHVLPECIHAYCQTNVKRAIAKMDEVKFYIMRFSINTQYMSIVDLDDPAAMECITGVTLKPMSYAHLNESYKKRLLHINLEECPFNLETDLDDQYLNNICEIEVIQKDANRTLEVTVYYTVPKITEDKDSGEGKKKKRGRPKSKYVYYPTLCKKGLVPVIPQNDVYEDDTTTPTTISDEDNTIEQDVSTDTSECIQYDENTTTIDNSTSVVNDSPIIDPTECMPYDTNLYDYIPHDENGFIDTSECMPYDMNLYNYMPDEDNTATSTIQQDTFKADVCITDNDKNHNESSSTSSKDTFKEMFLKELSRLNSSLSPHDSILCIGVEEEIESLLSDYAKYNHDDPIISAVNQVTLNRFDNVLNSYMSVHNGGSNENMYNKPTRKWSTHLKNDPKADVLIIPPNMLDKKDPYPDEDTFAEVGILCQIIKDNHLSAESARNLHRILDLYGPRVLPILIEYANTQISYPGRNWSFEEYFAFYDSGIFEPEECRYILDEYGNTTVDPLAIQEFLQRHNMKEEDLLHKEPD